MRGSTRQGYGDIWLTLWQSYNNTAFEYRRNALNSPHFIARRIVFGADRKRILSQPVVKIALAGVSLGVAVMVISVMVMNGFKQEITDKVTGFSSHLRVSKFDHNASLEEEPVLLEAGFLDSLAGDPAVRDLYIYATKAGIVKTGEAIQGVVLKGIGTGFNWRYFDNKLVAGSIPGGRDSTLGSGVIISSAVAALLGLSPGDDLVVYFISNPMRVRKFRISGIYETGLEEFDRTFVFCDFKILHKLNGWEPGQAGGVEITLHDFGELETAGRRIYSQAGYSMKTETVRELYPQIFNWLELIDINVVIIIVLMLAVAGMNMIATLLIIILDNTRLVGVLKSMGATDGMVRRVFLYVSVYVIGAGVAAGNLLAFSLGALQLYTGWFTLPPESYYVSSVPLAFDGWQLLLLNAGTITVCMAMMLLPVSVLSRIRPVKVLRFD